MRIEDDQLISVDFAGHHEPVNAIVR